MVDPMNNSALWTVVLAAGIFAVAMLARYLLGRSGLRDRIRPRTLEIVAWFSAGAAAVAVVGTAATNGPNLGWSIALLSTGVIAALLLHRQSPADPPPDEASNHRDHE